MRKTGLSIVRTILGLMLLGGLYEYAPRSWGFLGTMAAFAGLSLIVTLVHELGHALAARLQRGTVLAISVFGLTYLPHKARFELRPLPASGDIAGFVNFLPPEEDWARWQYGIVTAAGPLADAILALLALLASSLLEPAVSHAMFGPRPVAALASMLMVVAFVSALINLLPYNGSDGARLLDLWRGRNRFARNGKVRR